MPEPAASSFLQTLADEHGVDELLFAGKSTAAPTEARVEAGSPGAPLGAAVSDGDAAGGNGRVEKPLEELPAAHDDLAMVRESLSKLAPEWLPSKLADGKGPLSQADINRRHGYTDFDDLDLGGELGVGGFWDAASPEAKELIAGLLRRDPARRLSAAAALDCAWFAMDDTVLEYNKLHDVHDTLSVSHDHVQDTGHAHLRGVHVHDVIEAERLRKRADLLVRDIPDEVEVNLIFRGDFESANRGARQHTIGDAVFGCCAAGCGDAADAVYDMQAQARARR